jgi:hypothetical protein
LWGPQHAPLLRVMGRQPTFTSFVPLAFMCALRSHYQANSSPEEPRQSRLAELDSGGPAVVGPLCAR